MIEIVDYGAGNLTSVQRALNFLGVPSRITPDPEHIKNAERIIFPGVGAAGSSVATLRQRGLDEALKTAFARGTPILGICLGTQIIMSLSEEDQVSCLGLIPGQVVRFRFDDPALKIPHMGWDSVRLMRPHPLFEGVGPEDMFYFVHAYYPQPVDGADVIAETDYGVTFASVVGRKNLVATQFHPEKSGAVGLEILRRFARWEGN